MIKAVIFDCFGVIITDALQALCNELAESDPAGVADIKDIIAASNNGFIDPNVSSRKAAKILGMSQDEYRHKIRRGEAKDQALLDYIALLRKDYKTGMLSNIGKGSLSARFSKAKLAKYFDAVVASGDVGFAKPEARAYELVAERLDVRLDECIFTDDREGYCEAARAVGMQAILYESFPQFQTDLVAQLGNNQI